MKIKSIKKYSIILLISCMTIAFTGETHAALQSNPNTHAKKIDTPGNWMVNMRNMEKAGEAMGLSETQNSTTLKADSDNGIDVHMMRNTEYGAIAILSASGYGNSQTLQSSSEKTTTGNKTGIYFTGNNLESIAGGLNGYIFKNVDGRYFDTYEGDTTARAGDALGTATSTNPGARNWHSASYARWVNSSGVYFVRGDRGLFSFCYDSYAASLFVGRGVASCGAGL